ncbi:hypothetical protein [Winogradskyella arenosi]|uniref:Uncharacterized protein n=1 Tax=Winogradskyella arenosi TaxID=533325 RepID=A0A368ZE04_9FLAO|nr:hypothetical protein [Winogradskyella arenosi]RCW90174.1 hypothetical protein DFQ08_10563 [Winogradskyella arenosi]
MKSFYISMVCLCFLWSCKSDKKQTAEPVQVKQELTTAQKIAHAHGFEHWPKVSKVQFTFQVDKDTVKGKGRAWTWYPKENRVILKTAQDTVDYVRKEVDSTYRAADQAFINDKFWLLIPFQLVWDTTAELSEVKTATAPISKTQLNKITLTYPEVGGYTPGDAYDIYYNDDYIIKEWTFRKGNSKEPTLSTTFETLQDYEGIKIAKNHKQEGGLWNLNFTDVSITLDNKN